MTSSNQYETILLKHFGFNAFRQYQFDIIKAVIEDKRDVCATMYTGAGKSICYQFPAVYLGKTSIVISPLISLMNDQMMKMNALSIPSVCLNSTVCDRQLLQKQVLDGQYRVVYVTPEYIINRPQFLQKLETAGVLCLVAIDEAHTVSFYGNDFRPAFRSLSMLKTVLVNVPTITMTATATKLVEEDIIKTINLNNPMIVRSSFDRPNLFIKVCVKTTAEQDLMSIFKDNKDVSSIVYCQTRKESDNIADMLMEKGLKAKSYHAGKDTDEREEVHKEFQNEEINIVVATIAFGMGIDKVVRNVVHYGLPKDIESYYQEIGRAGRDREPAMCTLFYSSKDAHINAFLLGQIEDEKYREHRLALMNCVKEYIHLSTCRRKYILNYFGEKVEYDNCGNNCDNCKRTDPRKLHDFTQEASLFFASVYSMHKVKNCNYGATTIVEVMRGSMSKKTADFRTVATFGKGATKSEKWWKLFAQMLMSNNYLDEIRMQKFGSILFLTDSAVKWMKNPNRKMVLSISDELEAEHNKKGNSNVPPTKRRKTDSSEATAAAGVGRSALQTYQLFQDGNSIAQIAADRKVNTSTVESHLVECYKMGKPLDLDLFGFNDTIYNEIKSVLEQCPADTLLRDIKKKLPPHISYLHIHLTKARMNKDGAALIHL